MRTAREKGVEESANIYTLASSVNNTNARILKGVILNTQSPQVLLNNTEFKVLSLRGR